MCWQNMEKIMNKITDEATVPATSEDRRLLTLTQAANELNVSRMTVSRMCADGRLPLVETRAGRRWVPSAALTVFVKGAKGGES